MVVPQALALAAIIVADHFGDLVGRVCKCLLYQGTLGLTELARFAGISVSQTRNALLILIQHNCVQAFSTLKSTRMGVSTVAVTQYMALLDNIIHRLLFAKFMDILRKDLGGECGTLLEGLLQHGRLTFEQVVDRAGLKQSDGAARDLLRSNFNRLVRSHYVERCPRSEPFVAPVEDGGAPKKIVKSGEASLSTEQRAIVAAALLDSERFSQIMHHRTGISLDLSGTARDISVGEKRKHEALGVDDDVQTLITENEILWRANFDNFVYCLKSKACAANVRSRLGLDTGIILETMIDSGVEDKVKAKTHVKSPLDSIVKTVNQKLDGRSMTSEDVSIILDQLGCHVSNEETGVHYNLDLSEIVEIARKEEMETLVLRRYGKEAYRIFRLLMKNHPYETSKILDATFVEKSQAERILCNLWKDDCLDMERFGLQTSGPQMVHVWVVNSRFQEHILNDMYHAASNLIQKISQIGEKEQEALHDREKFQKLRMSRAFLECSLSKLGDSLLLFQGF